MEKFSDDMQELFNLLQNPRLSSNKQLPKEAYSAKAYLQQFVFPTLLPAVNELLSYVQKNNILSKKRSKFNACDYIAEYLYRNNPEYTNRVNISLENIPFVQRIMQEHPRAPLPMSLVWTDEEAAIKIQSYWRGYSVRKTESVQELREYQKEMRLVPYDIMSHVQVYSKTN